MFSVVFIQTELFGINPRLNPFINASDVKRGLFQGAAVCIMSRFLSGRISRDVKSLNPNVQSIK